MGQKIVSTNPADNYNIIGQVGVTQVSDIPKIIRKSRTALKEWRNVKLDRRQKFIQKVAESLETHADELSDLISLEMGMPKTDSAFDVMAGVSSIFAYIEQSNNALSSKQFVSNGEKHTTIKEPLGVVFAIAPWNFPVGNFIWLCIQALLAGNAVIYKASSEIPLFCQKLERLVNEILPKNIFTVIYGDHSTVERVIQEGVDAISFVGSTKTGIKIAELAAKSLTPINLELGGSAPGVVLMDANLDLAIEKIITYRFMNAGQVCNGLKRLIVDKNIIESVTLKMLDKVSNLTVGNPLSGKRIDMGPLVSLEQQKNVSEQVDDAIKKGARVLCGGKCLPGGAYYEPTIIVNINSNMRIWKEEVFGPVLPIVPFSTIDEAIRLANDTVYGLGGYIFTSSDKAFDKISKELETCMISRNGVSYVRKENFFGGCKLSGYGRENALRGFEHVTREKIISE